jgi:hypothetical protein
MARWKLAAGLAAIAVAAGCEIGDLSDNGKTDDAEVAAATTPAAEGASGEEQTDNAQNTEATATPAAVDPGQAEWDAIAWHTARGPNCKGAVPVMSLSARISSDGRSVTFGWDRYPWSGDGIGHFFVWDGSRWDGGKFEWIRSGGQKSKSLGNVHSGYNGLSAPASGTPCAFAWTSSDGEQRSNLAKTTWP